MNKNFSHCCTFVRIMVLHLIGERYLFSLFILDSKPQHSHLQISALQKSLNYHHHFSIRF